MMKVVRKLLSGLVWGLLAVLTTLLVALRLPAVQDWTGSKAASLLSEKLGTEVTIGRVDLGFLNRLILDDVIINDQQKRKMVRVARLTAKVDLAPLAVGRISISSAQLFGADLYLSKVNENTPANFQFVLDSLASKDTTSHTPLDLRINSLIVRHTSLKYDQWDVPQTQGKFNPKHLHIDDISAHIILKALKDDSLNVNVKRLALKEKSGLDIKRLTMKMAAGNTGAQLQEFLLQLPHTDIHIDSLRATYDRERLEETLKCMGGTKGSSITPSDFGWLIPQLKDYHHQLALTTYINYKERTLTVPNLQLNSNAGDISLTASGNLIHQEYGKDSWQVKVNHLDIADQMVDFVSAHITALPAPVLRLGNIHLSGNFASDAEGTLMAQADIMTAIGQAAVQLQLKTDKQYSGSLKTEGLNVGRLLANDKLGIVATEMEASGTLEKSVVANGMVSRLEYDGETYSNIGFDGSYTDKRITGQLKVNDARLQARADIDLKATTLNDAVGVVSIHDLNLPEKDYQLSYFRVESGWDEGKHFVTLNSDFAHIDLSGEFNYTTLAQSVANVIGTRLPTLPGLPAITKATGNNFSLQLAMGKTDWLKKLLDVNLDIEQPVKLQATVNDNARQLLVDLYAPAFTFNDTHYQNGTVHITSPNDTLLLDAAISTLQDNGFPFALTVDGNAADNNLSLTLKWDNNNRQMPVNGTLNATSHLYRNFDDQAEAHVSILPSDVTVYNSQWQIEPSDILYTTDRLLIDHFSIHNRDQYINIDGTASSHPTDTVVIDLNSIEVAYILDLVDFDAVSFAGLASGRACLTNAFNTPDAYANLRVEDFKFENGRMGVLTARVDWNNQDKQIDIHATANDGPDATTYINGYVSPERNYIDMALSARGTYLDFMHNFTESFISHITGHGKGDLRLAGPLSAINLTGGLRVDGEATITPLNTTYWLRNDTITMVYNEIVLDSLPIYDKYDNVGYLSGGIHHRDLTNLSLDLHVSTDRLLGYDFHDFGDQSFYGTVYASGDVDITMKGDDVHIDCNVTPLKPTVFVYNAAQNDAISSQEFITWKIPASKQKTGATIQQEASATASTTNIYMDFQMNITPEGTMRLLMDAKTGDYITLNGSGMLQASYYNKGTFQMQGTYTVEDGTYDVTIQNIINKKFQFQPGGTIIFGGDPYSAALNLQALYTVNGVSLSDLQLGNSFSSNTVRVNCLMNIGGQPSAPQVTFDLDLPTVNADEKQMVRSLLSSQQEMNQQVLYLLGIGRFYSQGQNNANQQNQQDQTSLAMQSFLSGTLSTQINNVINQIVKNDDWNFGANISTGTEGWNNAEYEGIVNGKMLNNRLLINGQFGYRDNATKATPSFIGDFDVRYLLYPNGNLALKVYNQTNDRYFTRSSLNTQGVGIIMKKDFNSLNEFFGIKKK